MQRPTPPKHVLNFFRWFCHPRLKDSIEGDLVELYQERVKVSGKRKADLKFIIDVMLLFRPAIIRPAEGHQNLNSYGMYKSYFIIGWRNLLRNKGYSIINIGGLALGMTVALVIGLWVYDELTYNRYHKNYDQLARVYRNNSRNGEIQTSTPQVPGLGTLLRDEYGSHFKNVAIIRGRLEDAVVGIGERRFTQQGYFVQPQFIEMFGLKMIMGSRNGLYDMKSIVISETLAKKLFPDIDALNQIISIDSKWDVKITGVYEDLPKNTEFNGATYFAPFDLYTGGFSAVNVWDNYFVNVYVQLNPGEDPAQVSGLIKDSMLPHIDAKSAESKPEIFLLPMSHLHLSSEFKNGENITSTKMQSVRYCSIIGAFVLLLACINFMNLSTARSEKRAREVGIRKAIGSQRSQLIQQFFSESFLVAIISFVISLLMTQLILPEFNIIADKNMTMPWGQSLFWVTAISFVLVTGFLAGSYPALYLSSFQPLKVLKGTFKVGKFASTPRRVLVVTQFTVSICLIAGTIIVYQQIKFAKNRPVGYRREGLITFSSRSPEFVGKYDVLRNEFIATGVVDDMAAADYEITTTMGNNDGFGWKGKDMNTSDPSFNTVYVSYDYGKTIGWEFIMGRDFSREFASDLEGVVINETAWKLMGLENPIGEILTRDRGDHIEELRILGVIRDMVKGSPYEPTNPAINFLTLRDKQWKFLRISSTVSPHEALPKIEEAYKKIITNSPFDYKFADEEYEAKFKSEERISTLALIFSSLAILISCSGLFGLSSFVAEQRTKEIGIRKVLGASISNVWKLLSVEFVILVIIACAIAIPVTYYFMNNWLLQYNYHITMSWYVFAMAGTGALIITLITVSFQAIKAAVANPVNSLRSE